MDGDLIVKLVLGICGPGFGAWGLVRVAQIRAANKTPAQSASTPLADNIALNAYIDKKIEDATRPLRQQIARMARVLPVLREAFRKHIRDVARDWGKTPHPPQIDPTVRAMLLDEDLDNTFGDDDARDIRAEYHEKYPSPDDYG